jgi:acetyl esterase
MHMSDLDPASARLLCRLRAVADIASPSLEVDLAGEPEPIAMRAEAILPLQHGAIAARIYRDRLDERQPLLLWMHGGGFCGGSLDDIDTVCTALARRARVIVVSLDYRLAPKHPFPAALTDCVEAIRWLSAHASALGGNGQLAIGGQSAGANLAAATTLLVRDRGGPSIDAQVLAYPALDFDQSGESHKLFDGVFFDQRTLAADYERYLGGRPASELAAPLLADWLGGLPPALILTAGCDPLRDDARRYAARLSDEGTDVDSAEYPGAVHAFLNFCGALPYAWDAIDRIASFLQMRLAPATPPSARLQHATLLYDPQRSDAARSFYCELLGLKEKPPPEAFTDTGIIWLEAGSDQRELHLVPNDFPDAAPHLCLAVADIRAAAAHARDHSLPIEYDTALPGRPGFVIQDPFGNIVEVTALTEPRPDGTRD